MMEEVVMVGGGGGGSWWQSERLERKEVGLGSCAIAANW
jgi:hypothetical protein